MKRETKITKAKEQAKSTSSAAIGINVTKLNLVTKEKSKLVREGFNFATGRNNHLVMNYSQNARIRDLRGKILNKKKLLKTKKVTLQYIRAIPNKVEISIDEAIDLIEEDSSHRKYTRNDIRKAIDRGIKIQLVNHTLQMVGVGADANSVLEVV